MAAARASADRRLYQPPGSAAPWVWLWEWPWARTASQPAAAPRPTAAAATAITRNERIRLSSRVMSGSFHRDAFTVNEKRLSTIWPSTERTRYLTV